MTSYGPAIRRFFKKWQPILLLIGAAIWTVVTAGVTAYWTKYQFDISRQDTIDAKAVERADAEKSAAITRRIEAQRPFLDRKLGLFFEVVQHAEHLTEWELDTKSERWKNSAKRFWELRWGELEMVGDPGIRQAARRVGVQIIETEYEPERDRHDLRWSVECLADELRYALEHAWGLELKKRISPMGEEFLKLPTGCTEGRGEAPILGGMQAVKAPGNLRR